MRAIGLANHKGGIAKTTSALNLGDALAREGKSVVLIDLDPAAGLTKCLGFASADVPAEASTVALLRGSGPLVLQAVSRNLQLLASAPGPMVMLERELGERGGAQFDRNTLARVINADFVILDPPPNLGPLMAATVRMADAIILPFQTEPLAVLNMREILPVLPAMNPQVEILGALPTIYDARRKISDDAIAQVRDGLKLRVFKPVPRVVALAETPIHTKSIFDVSPKSAAADAYRELGKEVLKWASRSTTVKNVA